jgi:hypothetical protein
MPAATTAGIEYRAQFDDGREWSWVVDLDRAPHTSGSLPAWTELSRDRCPSCPLGDDQTHCPAAVDLVPIASALGELRSVDRAHVTVTMGDRQVLKETDTQELGRSLIGLVLSTSACPVLRALKPLAHHHAPFATFEETLFRVVGLQLVRTLLDATHPERGHEGGEVKTAVAALTDLYSRLEHVNRSLAVRLRHACERDAGPNAVIQLFSVGLLVADELDGQLDVLRAFVTRA